MANHNYGSPRDDNNVPAILVIRADDLKFPMNVYVNPSNHRMIVEDQSEGNLTAPKNAPRDGNSYPVLMGISSADGKTPIPIAGNFQTGAMLIQST